jgi:hypothetical protein
LPERVTIALGELAGAVKDGLLALSVGAGLAIVKEIMSGSGWKRLPYTDTEIVSSRVLANHVPH